MSATSSFENIKVDMGFGQESLDSGRG